jgi:hypothetical protein
MTRKILLNLWRLLLERMERMRRRGPVKKDDSIALGTGGEKIGDDLVMQT